MYDDIFYKMAEAKNITYLSEDDVGEDIHLVKEVVVKDGVYHDRINIIKDFKRPFYITKPMYRNHDEKKESELVKNVNRFLSTESKLKVNCARRLGISFGNNLDRLIKKSPYIYGIDVDARTYLKHTYIERTDNLLTPYRIGVYDIEYDVLESKLIILSLATKKVLKIGLLKSFAGRLVNLENKLQEMYDKYIPDTDFKNDVTLDVRIFNTEVEIIKWIFHEANYAEIDILTGWNIKYDMTTILDILEHNDIDPADVFHYDKIPDKYKYFKFIEGKNKKITEAGREISMNIEDQWHVYRLTANYMMLDAMSTHKYIRVGGASVPGGYSLDNILKHEKIAQKLSFSTNQGFKGLEWHIEMVANKPEEYITYNGWDDQSILALDDKTQDLSISLPLLTGVSHPDIFNSGPRRIVDALTFFYLQNGRVLGVKDMSIPNDKILGLSNWIITLQAYMLLDNGLKNIAEYNEIITLIKSYVYDNDQASGYPSNTMAANVSKDTTHREVKSIGDIEKIIFMLQNINLMYGKTNAMEYCQSMFKLPSMFTLIENKKEILEAA